MFLAIVFLSQNIAFMMHPVSRASFFLSVKERKCKSANVDTPRRSIAPEYKPKNDIQVEYIRNMLDKNTDMVIAHGPAGTGKTLFACVHAVNSLISGDVKRLILTRPAVAVEGEELGFLPGDLVDKMSPYTQPLFDILHEFYSKTQVKMMISAGIIEVSPLAFMRGRTFKDAIIIADEMQNSTPNQMLMLATRIGTNSKLIITGDLQQSDRNDNNGLADLLNRVKYRYMNETRIRVSDMSACEVLRSKVVREVIDLYTPKTVMRRNISIHKKEMIEECDYGCEDFECEYGCVRHTTFGIEN